MNFKAKAEESLKRLVTSVAEWETALNSGEAGEVEVLAVVQYNPDNPRYWLPMAPTVIVRCNGQTGWVSVIESRRVRVTATWVEVVTHDQHSPEVASLIRGMVDEPGERNRKKMNIDSMAEEGAG